MSLNVARLLSSPVREIRQVYTKKDTIIYALGVGAGIDAAEGRGLDFVFEDQLKALPTMAVVLASPGFWQRGPEYGITWQKVLHAEQSATFHRPLPVEGQIIAEFSITEIYDKGASKGALLYAKRTLHEKSSGALIATVVQSSFLRGDGGFGGESKNPRVPYAIPANRLPDHLWTSVTRPEQAFLYRLSGDYNPLHIDPKVAQTAGFDRPILHGLCTYAIAGRAVMNTLCNGDPDRLKRLDVRFSSPVYPGETIEFDIWMVSPGKAGLRARVVPRQVVVLDNGYVEYEAL